MNVSDREWFAIRAAARRLDWQDVERRATAMGWLIVAKHAKRAPFEQDSIRVVVHALLLDKPDAPDPFANPSDDPPEVLP